jgi:hypothetical protein
MQFYLPKEQNGTYLNIHPITLDTHNTISAVLPLVLLRGQSSCWMYSVSQCEYFNITHRSNEIVNIEPEGVGTTTNTIHGKLFINLAYKKFKV